MLLTGCLLLGGHVERWRHGGDCSAFQHHVVEAYVYMSFTCSNEEEAYAGRLVQIVQKGFQLSETVSVSHSLGCLMLAGCHELLHFLTSVQYWCKETQFDQKFPARRSAVLFVNRHCIKMIDTRSCDHKKFLDGMSS